MKLPHSWGFWHRRKPAILRHSLTTALIHRWSAMLTHAAMHAFAASLLDQELSRCHNIEGQPRPLQPTTCPLPRRPAWTWPSRMHIRGPPVYKWPPSCQMPGNWPVKQSLLSKYIASGKWFKVSETCRPKGSLFRAKAGTTNHIYISRSSTFSERSKFVSLIHPIKHVLGTLSPVSHLIVPAKVLSHRVPSVKSNAANWSSVFWEPIQCSHNPSPSWQVGNIVSKFLVLFQAHGRPRFQSMTSREKVHSFVPMMKDFMPRQCPIHVTRWPNRWNAATGEAQYPSCTELVCTPFCGQLISIISHALLWTQIF